MGFVGKREGYAELQEVLLFKGGHFQKAWELKATYRPTVHTLKFVVLFMQAVT